MLIYMLKNMQMGTIRLTLIMPPVIVLILFLNVFMLVGLKWMVRTIKVEPMILPQIGIVFTSIPSWASVSMQ